jgi:hypothetical protein
MTTPIVIETSRNGNPVGRPGPTGPTAPVATSTDEAW